MQLEFTVNNISTFSNWLKRFSSIDKSLLLEVDLETKQFIAKTYNEERSVVKFSSIRFNDIGFDLKTKNLPAGRIHVGLYDTVKIVKTFSQFSENFSLIIKYDNIEGNDDTKLIGKQLLLKNDTIKVGFECTSLNIFNYIKDKVFTDVICKVDPLLTFDLKTEDYIKISNLSDLDKEYKRIDFRATNSEISLRSKSFELKLGICNSEKVSLPILKDQFEKVDPENYSVQLAEGRMILSSTDSNTITALGGLDVNEYDSDKEMEL